MNTFIPSREELEEIVQRAVEKTVKETLPEAIRKASRKEWLTTDDVMEILQCSRPHVQHLRDSKQIPFTQNGRTIRYHYDDVEAFLKEGRVQSRE